ncbi:hypothetical protein B9T62_09365 [Paenibacillus donghaensis]|uniref:Uncharacterized protein n=1 Tax=Paenibacillus donghaensis TaxID=414771 RepID=A0A2Z2K4T8_9BACL|nr:hypothetical protein B9T62_09365 [Paenibacillus donghaensis]
MFFSTIETIAVYCVVMTLFRFKSKQYIWEALFVSLLINLQSYILRTEFSMSYLVPLITVMIFTFLFAVVVKIPLIWSLISTILGYAVYAFLQIAFTVLLFGSISAAQSSASNGYLLQFATGTITILLSIWLYKIGWGFKFDFERLRFKFEDVFIIVLIIVFLILISIIFYYNQLFLLILFFTSTIVFLLYYAIWKEKGK